MISYFNKYRPLVIGLFLIVYFSIGIIQALHFHPISFNFLVEIESSNKNQHSKFHLGTSDSDVVCLVHQTYSSITQHSCNDNPRISLSKGSDFTLLRIDSQSSKSYSYQSFFTVRGPPISSII